MVGTSMIGQCRKSSRWRVTCMPPEARSSSRLLKLLGSPEISSRALLDSVQSITNPQCQEFVSKGMNDTIEEMGREGWSGFLKGQAEERMALALGYAVNGSVHNALSRPTQDDESLTQDDILPTQTKLTKERSSALAIVSDSSAVSSEEDSYVQARQPQAAVEMVLEMEQKSRKLWASILESLHLQVASRTTRTWGKKKIYEIYELCSPVKQLETQNAVETVRTQTEKEFRTIYHGGGEDQSGCRVYALFRDGRLYIQINIGKSFDFRDEQSNRSLSGEKKKKKPNEYIAILEPGSALVALTASRAPSRKTAIFTPYVLKALELSATSLVTVQDSLAESLVPERVGDWAGSEPLDLLGQARNALDHVAVGRFAKRARDESTLKDPLEELQKVSSESVLCRSKQSQRLETAKQHGRHVARLQQQSQCSIMSSNEAGVLINASSHQDQKRKRSRDMELGDEGDCPKMQLVAWKWTGETSAAASCLLDNVLDERDLPKIEFKCGIVMEGKNVFEGLRSLMAAGYTKSTLPNYVKDAPTLGKYITVDHGEFGGTESFAAV